MKAIPKIFISYSWKNTEVVEEIDRYFKGIGIDFIRDVRDVGYRQSIKEYMKRIRQCDYALIILSEDFLKSQNCMYEIHELLKDENYKERVLPILLDDAKIFKIEDKSNLIKFWNDSLLKIKFLLNEIEAEHRDGILEDLKIIHNICSSIGAFINVISDMNHINIFNLKKNKYKELLEIINFDNDELITELLDITHLQDKEEQDLKLEIFLKNHPFHERGNFFKGYIAFQCCPVKLFQN